MRWPEVALLCLLSACLPATALPPPLPAGEGHMVDVGVLTGGERAARQDCAFQRLEDGAWDERCTVEPEVRWMRTGGFLSIDAGPRWQFGGTLLPGSGGGLAGGGFARRTLLDRDRLRLGVHGEAGLLYLGVGLPVAARLGRRTWLHTLPRLSTTHFQGTHEASLPLGVSVEVAEWLRLSAEVAAVWGPLVGLEGRPVGRAFLALTLRPRWDPRDG